MTGAGVVWQKARHGVLERGEGRPGERVLDGGVVHTDPLLEPVQDDLETLILLSSDESTPTEPPVSGTFARKTQATNLYGMKKTPLELMLASVLTGSGF